MIRHYIQADDNHLLKLLALNTPKYFADNEKEDYASYLANEVEDYYLFEHHGMIIGAGGINYFKDKRKAYLSWDLVHPEHHKKGVGSQIMHHRLNRIKQNIDIDTVVVRTSQLADKYYEKFGFVLINTSKDYWGKGFDLYEMHMPNK